MKRLEGRAKPTSDIAAKKIFSYELATLNFIKDILDLEATSVTILDGTQIYITNDDHYNNFNTSIDVLAQLNDGTQVIIEIQIIKQAAFINRLWVYICKQVVDNFEKLKINDNKTHNLYKYLKPVYSIVIFEHNYFDDNSALHTFSLREDKTHDELKMNLGGYTESNPLKLAFLELKKYDSNNFKDYNKKKWFEFFANNEFTIEPDELILKLENILNRNNWSKEEQAMYDEKTRTEDMRYAELDYAETRGKQEGINSTIKTLLDSGFDVEKIKSLFSLSDSDIEKLKR